MRPRIVCGRRPCRLGAVPRREDRLLSVLLYRATIKRYMQLEADGKSVRSLQVVETGVPCRLEDVAEHCEGGTDAPRYDAVAYFLLTTDLRPRGRGPDARGDILEIRRTSYEVLRVEDAEEHRLVARLQRLSEPAGDADGSADQS